MLGHGSQNRIPQRLDELFDDGARAIQGIGHPVARARHARHVHGVRHGHARPVGGAAC